jgi:competence protein ComEC
MAKWRPDRPIRGQALTEVIVGRWSKTGSFSVSDAYGQIRPWLIAAVSAEIDARRPVLWLAPLTILGVLVYFIADEEPNLWASLSLSAVLLSAFIVFRNARESIRIVLVALLAIILGFTSAKLRTLRADAPILKETIVTRVEAIVETIDWSTNGGRLLLRPIKLGNKADNIPFRLRATLAGRAAISPGDHISGLVRLLPPPFPARPGGYDFARDAYFARIGGVGSFLGSITVLPPVYIDWKLAFMAEVDAMRIALTDRIAQSIGGQSGAVAAALFTGKRGYISDQTNDALRAAGIYHVVSISGLHMVLAAGMVFFLVRGFLVLIPGVALRFPVKQWAAGCAMVGATAYDIFAGSEVATERSLIMTLVMFGAVLIGRRALSMRNLVIAALIIIAMEPESVLGPSFQMSFAAVAALVAAFEHLPPRGDRPPTFVSKLNRETGKGPPPTIVDRLWGWLLRHSKTVLLTTLLAEAATGPYSAFHFQRFQPLGLIGNALTIPLIESLAMPIGFLGVLAIPFGLDHGLWQVMGFAVDGMLYVSRLVAATPFATQALPAISVSCLVSLSFGLLWLTLWSSQLRFLGVIPILFGLALTYHTTRPDVVVARDGQSLAARGPDGKLIIMGKGASAFVVAQWLSADGDLRRPTDPTLRQGAFCNASGCLARITDGKSIAISLRSRDLEDDCNAVSIIVSPLDIPSECKALAIDAKVTQSLGSVALLPDGAGGYTIQGARSAHYDRPWSPKPKPAPAVQSLSPSEADDPTAQPITPR